MEVKAERELHAQEYVCKDCSELIQLTRLQQRNQSIDGTRVAHTSEPLSNERNL